MTNPISYRQTELTFEHTVYRTSLIIGIMIALVLTIVDSIYLGLDISIILEGTGLLFLVLFYIISSRYKAVWQYVFFIIFFFTLSNLAWIFDGGSNIIHILIYLLISIYSVLIIPPLFRGPLMIFIIINGLVLISIEVYGTINLYYLDHDPEQQVTFRIILFCALLSLLFAMIYFRRRFDQERDSLIAKNLELKNLNELVNQRNQELIASTDRLTKINQDIKQESEALTRRNKEINDVKKNLEKNILERTKQLVHKNEELDLLFYRSSHDFRRPLASLLGLSEFARLIQNSEAREILELVGTTALEMDKMFKKFNSLYQINHFEEEFQQVRLSEIINKSRKNIEKTGGQFDFVSHGLVLDLMNSKNLLLKIMLDNLIENSINYSNNEVVNKIQLEFTKVDTNLEIALLDNGVGIDKQYVDQVFEMYFKANLKSKGNGLGLYVVKKAVEKLDGSISLETEAGKFTKVHITLPYFED